MAKGERASGQFDIWYLPFVFLLLAFALRVYHLDAQSIWWDEGHSIQMASAALARIPTLPGMDVHPPGYFGLLHGWMAVAGRSEFGLRYLSVVFSTLTVALLMRFGRALGARRAGWSYVGPALVGGLAALSPLYVAYAQEVRMYAVVTFFALTSVYFQWWIITKGEGVERPTLPLTLSLLGREDSLIWPLAGYILSTTASLYTHYFTIFLLLFQNLAWLVWALAPSMSGGRRRARIAVWLTSQLAILILFSLQIPLALRQTTAYANPNLDPPGVGEFLSRSWRAYTVGTAMDPAAGGWLAGMLAVVLGLIVLAQVVNACRGVSSHHAPGGTMKHENGVEASLARVAEPGRAAGDDSGQDRLKPRLQQVVYFQKSRRTRTVAFLVGWFLVPLAIYFLVLQRRPSFEPRYMMLVTPALMLLLAWGLAGWRMTDGRWQMAIRHLPSAVGYLLVVAAFGPGTWSYFTNVEAYKDDSAGVAAWLAAETTPNDVVYVDVPHPFHYYADRIPAPTRYLFVDVHTAADVLNAEAAGRDRLFWVTWWGSDTDPRGVIPFLLDKAGRRAGEMGFRGYHVTWWDLPPAGHAHFSLPDDLSPVHMTFGDVVRLDGLAFSGAARVGGSAWATLHFTLLRDTDVDYRVSLRLHSPEGDMLPPTDKDLLNDRHFRTSAWPLDDPRLNQTINVYILTIPPDTPPDDYRLEAVVYDAATLEALPVTGVSTPDGTSASLGVVAVSP